MKAFKGCVNQDCIAFTKKHYKDEDEYCTRCGEKLRYVCADCWKALESNKVRYCIPCKALRDDKKDQRTEKIKENTKKAGVILASVAPAMTAVAKNVKQIEKASETFVNVGKKVVNVISKK